MASENDGHNCVGACKETQVTEVGVDLDHITKGCAVCFKNGGDAIDGLLRLLFDAVAHQLPGDRVDGTRSSHKDEIPALHPWE